MKLKLEKSLTDVDWEEIVALGPGVRMYKGKKSFFYNGEILQDAHDHPVVHNEEERRSWEVIIVLPGVEVILWYCFRYLCYNVKTVIMADTVKRIEEDAFLECFSLEFVRLSRNLEYIGKSAFWSCESLTSIFIPPSCTEIDDYVFQGCEELIILSIPQHTQLGINVIANTALFGASQFFETDEDGFYSDPSEEDGFYYSDTTEVNAWVKTINNGGLALHRICSSDNLNLEQVYRYVKDHGLRAMKHPNSIGITPSQYLAANPYSEIEEGVLVKRYVLEMMGEVV